jgi:hypothetical protein
MHSFIHQTCDWLMAARGDDCWQGRVVNWKEHASSYSNSEWSQIGPSCAVSCVMYQEVAESVRHTLFDRQPM